jgi:hypothetical protein
MRPLAHRGDRERPRGGGCPGIVVGEDVDDGRGDRGDDAAVVVRVEEGRDPGEDGCRHGKPKDDAEDADGRAG